MMPTVRDPVLEPCLRAAMIDVIAVEQRQQHVDVQQRAIWPDPVCRSTTSERVVDVTRVR